MDADHRDAGLGPGQCDGQRGAEAIRRLGGGRVEGADEAGIPAGFGLAVISGLADDVRVSSTSSGVSVRMSWPSAVTV